MRPAFRSDPHRPRSKAGLPFRGGADATTVQSPSTLQMFRTNGVGKALQTLEPGTVDLPGNLHENARKTTVSNLLGRRRKRTSIQKNALTLRSERPGQQIRGILIQSGTGAGQVPRRRRDSPCGEAQFLERRPAGTQSRAGKA